MGAEMIRVRSLLLIIMSLSLLVLTGCSSDDAPPLAPEESELPAVLIGDNDFLWATINGNAASLAEALDWQPTTAWATFQISTDKTFIYTEWNDGLAEVTWSETGIFTVSGGTFTMTVQVENGKRVKRGAVSGAWDAPEVVAPDNTAYRLTFASGEDQVTVGLGCGFCDAEF